MTLVEALQISLAKPEVICLVGAGGKTTTMFALARELNSLEKRVLVTTTTNIAYPEPGQCDRVVLEPTGDLGVFAEGPCSGVVCYGAGVIEKETRKFASVAPEVIARIHRRHLFDYILVEGDGAKRKPVKAPARYEPVIPACTSRVLGVVGLDALGVLIADDQVHRPELFCAVTGKKPGDAIDIECLAALICSPIGLLKGVPRNCARYVLLNKADTDERRQAAGAIVNCARQKTGFIRSFIIASMREGCLHAVR